MPKFNYSYYSYLQVVYDDGRIELVRDSSDVIWKRFHVLLSSFRLPSFVGVLQISVLDNAKRSIVSLNIDCYGKVSNSIH